eukprot:XP_001701970.1 predicted protein [Chlamydomonas reinhardtii]
MFSFFTNRDRWKWDKTKGVPTKDALKRLRKAVRSGAADARKRALQHVAELAEAGPDFQSALCDSKVTAEVFPAHRLPLLEADGVPLLVACLKDLALPWSVRLQAAAAGSPSVSAELVRARGLEVVYGFVDAYVKERHGVPGAPVQPTPSLPPRFDLFRAVLTTTPTNTNYPAKRLLHLLGALEAEYCPFARYGGPLLEALLANQRGWTRWPF